jgi:hypothetical protein
VINQNHHTMMKELLKKEDSKAQVWIPLKQFELLADKRGNIDDDCQNSSLDNNTTIAVANISSLTV